MWWQTDKLLRYAEGYVTSHNIRTPHAGSDKALPVFSVVICTEAQCKHYSILQRVTCRLWRNMLTSCPLCGPIWVTNAAVMTTIRVNGHDSTPI